MTALLALSYLGVLLCYAASPASGVGPAKTGAPRFRWMLRGAGFAIIAGTGVAAVAGFSGGYGAMLWGMALMTAASVVVIAAPLVDGFVRITGLAALMILIGSWWM